MSRPGMKRISVLLTAWLGLSTMVRAEEARPNVVLIVADDLGWADLGCYGSRFYRTPRLDQWASSGRSFTQAYAACPVCSPTRASLMTGKYPARLRLTDWIPGRPDSASQPLLHPAFLQQLPLEEVTLAEMFKGAGYATANIGKWHLGGEGFDPTRQGFDKNVAGDAYGSPRSYWPPYFRSEQLAKGLGEVSEKDYLTDRLTTVAEHFIEENASRPFFLYLPHYAVHTPLIAKPELEAHYPAWNGTSHGRQENPTYAAMLESLDQSVGRILDTLERRGLTSKTIVVFTSDNGGLATSEGPSTPATINAPLREGKGWLYEGGIRVPLIVSWPGHITPGVESSPACSIDVLPTLRALAGINGSSSEDGTSLDRLLTRGEPLAARSLYWHYPHYSPQGGRPGGAIRSGKWKLIDFFETGRLELFDLERDPGESTNLAQKEPQQTQELAKELRAWRQGLNASMPTSNPAYSPNRQKEDGKIELPASTAQVHGVMLRFEPLPHKNTLGYWIRPEDWASWEFDVVHPGTFNVEALVGCGTGSGGSRVEFKVGEEVLALTVPETGGFQKFETQHLGQVNLPRAGRLRIEVRARSKPGPAVMDLRRMTLIPAAAR